MDVFDGQAAFLSSKEVVVSEDLVEEVGQALDRSDLNAATVHILSFRMRCGYSRSQQKILFGTYCLLFAWSTEQGRALPGSLVDMDMDSIEGQIVNQALVELVIGTVDSTKNDMIAQLCEQMCRAIVHHGMSRDEVAKRWSEQGIPPLLLARRPYFNKVREQHFMGDLGL